MRLDNPQTPVISVTGEAVVTRKADLAYVTLFITADGILLEDAVKESTRKVEQALQTLRDTYRDIRDIQIKDMSVGESKPALGFARDKTYPPRPEVVKGVLVTILPDPELAVKIVDTASRIGCTLGGPTAVLGGQHPQHAILYGIAEPAEAQQEATARAIAEAKEKASRLARMVEKRIGSIRSVGSTELMMPEDMMMSRKNPILLRARYLSSSPDAVEISAKVHVTFELLD
jgi:uncharacterized protein YggE